MAWVVLMCTRVLGRPIGTERIHASLFELNGCYLLAMRPYCLT